MFGGHGPCAPPPLATPLSIFRVKLTVGCKFIGLISDGSDITENNGWQLWSMSPQSGPHANAGVTV